MLSNIQPMESYIPQKQPMVMISGMVKSAEQSTISELHITADNLLVERDCLSEAGIVENIAQTAALHAGYNLKPGEPIKTGFIAALKNLQIYQLPKVGSRIETEIKLQHIVFGTTVIAGKVMLGDTLLADCEMKIYVQEDED